MDYCMVWYDMLWYGMVLYPVKKVEECCTERSKITAWHSQDAHSSSAVMTMPSLITSQENFQRPPPPAAAVTAKWDVGCGCRSWRSFDMRCCSLSGDVETAATTAAVARSLGSKLMYALVLSLMKQQHACQPNEHVRRETLSCFYRGI